jgi:AraC-like DNA-binding protein
MKVVKAFSKDFFPEQTHPINVIRISGDDAPQHDGDLTNVKHYHDFSELVIITRGYGTHWIDGADYPVAAGDVFVLQGKTEHYFKERHGLVLYNIMYDNNRLRQYLRNLQGTAGYNAMFLLEPHYRKRHKFKSRLHISRRSLAHVEAVTQRMLEEQDARRPGYDTMLLCMLLELVIFFSRKYSKADIPQIQTLYRIGKIIGKLETSYKNNWNIAELSKLAGMSKSSLMTAFKDATGHSPVDYVIRIRLQKAAELLTQTDLPISRIAAECGFNDSNYLTRQFSKVYRMPPKQYRINHL